MDEKQIKLTGGRRALAVSALVCAPQLPRPPSPPWAGRGGDSDGVPAGRQATVLAAASAPGVALPDRRPRPRRGLRGLALCVSTSS